VRRSRPLSLTEVPTPLTRRHATATAAPRIPESGPVQRAVLGVPMLGCFVVALDAQIVNAALPEIRGSLGGGLSGLQLTQLAGRRPW
jgi:MFS transporter, DHA2 family, methylenomycin A resistance protein